MKIQLAMLWSDWMIWALFVIVLSVIFFSRKNQQFREPMRQIFQKKMGMVAAVILCFYIVAGLLDCVHLQMPQTNHGVQTTSLLDIILGDISHEQEKTYSKPFARQLYTQSLVTLPSGKMARIYPPLKHVSTKEDVAFRLLFGIGVGIISMALLIALFIKLLALRHRFTFLIELRRILCGKTRLAWREAFVTLLIVGLLVSAALGLASGYHIFGTNKIGQDVFFQTIKSIRTGIIIGTLTTLFMLPFAIIFGTMAGYFGGWVDDFIQYVYTTLSSIPGVLLISASILALQVYINNHPSLFPTLAQRADARLLALCFILGITSWASLCRLLRGESLKLRELDYVQAAKTLGVKHWKILYRHIFPNVLHIIIITVVLDFSMLVLAEAVLSYVGVGVDPTTLSWGNMINSSRLELAREPVVWWPLLASLIFMFFLVLAANLFADVVRDAFDPRLRQID